MSDMTTPPPDERQQQIRIWQQNLNKSLDAHSDLLHSLRSSNYHLAMLQEPYMDFNNTSRATPNWHVVYPSRHNSPNETTRAVILVNAALSSCSWSQIPIPSTDVVGIQIHGDFGTIRFINVYNDCTHNRALDALHAYMRDPSTKACPAAPLRYVWQGDFNRHSPLWDEERNAHLFTHAATRLAQPLLGLLGQYGMKMLLAKDTPMLRAKATGNHTRPDNVFCSDDLFDAFISCQTAPAQRPVKTDHYPILSLLDIAPDIEDFTPRRTFRETDWDEFGTTLCEELSHVPEPEAYASAVELERAITQLDAAIDTAIDKHTPLSRPCPHAKRWWTMDLTKAKKAKQKLARLSYRKWADPTHPIHESYRLARNAYSLQIRKTKAEHWEEWLEGMDEASIWTASRMALGPAFDGGRCKVPTLRIRHPTTGTILREASDNATKSTWLFKEFFPKKPATSTVPPDCEYPDPAWRYQEVTEESIHRIIRKMQPYKATMSGTAPNCVYKYNSEVLVPRLAVIYRAIDSLGHYPERWKTTETVVLRKPGKADYTDPSAHRPIVLSAGHARTYNAIKTEQIVIMAEKRGLIPANHYGGRPG